ncbi:MAG TPA: beta-galactosidase trimerization domain-containing protein, partial [Candidatus Mediterraneibacter cottocaccae]|nr:beta-galactosidase trimerization domain-containing protein [Candidatus Mediterraneibacter cottocaccae]
YPFWHKEKDEVPVAVQSAFNHSMMRAMKKKPFLLMESAPSVINWRNNNPVKRPGMHMLSSMQAVAHGSDSVQYFQWRKGRGSYEKFHGAVLDHKNRSDTRTFREVAEVGKRLPGLEKILDGTVNRPEAAVIFDWANWWAVEDTTGPRLDLDYPKYVMEHYRAFWEQGIEADIVDMDADLSGYRLVSAPLNYMYKAGWPEKVRAFVESGGTFVTTFFSGMADETDLCFTGQHPLEDVLGIVQEEIDAPSQEFENQFAYNGTEYPARRMCEIDHAKEGTEVLSSYERDFYAGCPVVTHNTFGKGAAYYLAAESDTEFLRAFYRDVFGSTGLKNALGTELPYGVTVTKRTCADPALADGAAEKTGYGDVVFVMNFRNEPVCVDGIGKWTDAENGAVCEGKLELEAFQCAVLVEQDK